METYTAFDGEKLLCRGPLSEVVLQVTRKAAPESVLIFHDETGRTMDFNFRGSEKEVLKRLEVYVSGTSEPGPAGPGRPRLGVISREVSLLPRHWEWLATQPGGASATLRKLVEDARRKSTAGNDLKRAQERTYKFLSVMAGDREGYEEALRALYRKDEESFTRLIRPWPRDLRSHALQLAEPVFAG